MTLPLAPAQEWWTPAELAEAALPGLPASLRRINVLASEAGWRESSGRARRRAGKGGGWEYHYSLFPSRAQLRLISMDADRAAGEPEPEARGRRAFEGSAGPTALCSQSARGADWETFERLPAEAQAVARERLDALRAVEALIDAGRTANFAVNAVAELRGVSARSLWNWRKAVAFAAPADRLPLLAPRHRTALRKVETAPCSEAAWDAFKADLLRPARPSLTSAWRRMVRVAGSQGWDWPSEKVIRRRVKAEIPRAVWVLAREGTDKLKRLYPPQERDKSQLGPLGFVNADFHRFDVFVEWEEGRIIRPQMVAFQDIWSGMILAWRMDETPNSLAVSLALGDLVEDWGIPERCLLDNGREFAAKWITGGTPTRFRFKVKESDPAGLLPLLGVEVHWATPYAGQSKPVERAFRDMCDAIAKDPRFDGAWTGNKPEAKPEDYASRAIPREEFLSVVAEGIAEHNARPGRRAAVCAGRSFAETFAEGYATAPIRKATPEQRRLWLCGAEGLRGHGETGGLKLEGNRYWSPWMVDLAGKPVVGRFDPADLHAGLHVYAADGRYLGHAECVEPVGFDSLEGAKAHARARNAWKRAQRAELDAHRRVSRTGLKRLLDASAEGPAPAPETKVVRPAFGRVADEDLMRAPARRTAPPPAPEVEAARAALVADFEARREAKGREAAAREESRDDRHDRCVEILTRIAEGGRVGEEERRWAEVYRGSSEFRSTAALRATFGDYRIASGGSDL